jgi:nicotinamide riboside kinase
MADEYARKSRWDKIYLLCPKGTFVDDHSRFMIHSGMEERQELFEILCENIKRTGNWDKVTILDGGYWKNFERIVKDVKEIIENDKLD